MIEIGPVQPLDRASFDASFEAMRHDAQVAYYYDGERLEFHRVLGEGGTKTVYDTCISGEPLALALPNTVDNAEVAARKWQEALREPLITNVIRELGFMVNTCCQIMPIRVNDIPFPAIRLTRYADLPIEVRDRKNPSSSVVKGDIFGNTLTLDGFIETSHGVVDDTAKLVRQGVLLGSDSLNLGRDGDGLHLFLNDLARARFEDLSEEDAAEYANGISRVAIDALLGGLSREEYDRHREFFKGEAFHFRHGEAYARFTNRVLAEAGISS